MNKNFIIGFCMIVALVILFFGIEFLKGVNVFRSPNTYYAVYTNVEGLQVSAPVNVNGFKVGQVKDIAYMYDNPGHVKVALSLDSDLKVPDGTVALIKVSLLGTADIDLAMGQSQTILPNGSMLSGEIKLGMMDKVSSELIPSVGAVVPHVDSLIGNVNTLVTDPALAASLKNIETLTDNLSTTVAAVNSLLKNIPPIVGNVKDITEELRSVSSNLNAFTASLNDMPIDSTLTNVRDITANVKALTESLNSSESSLGKLLNEDGFYSNLNNVAVSLDSLLTDIKKNPKRYISIKLL